VADPSRRGGRADTLGKPLGAAALWNKIGLTPMIGTNDVQGQVFTLDDAAGLNSFAQERGVGRISIWSLNRDTGCESQLRNGVSNSCSGVDQEPGMFAELLGSGRSSGRLVPVAHNVRGVTRGALRRS
jgi:chitinase